MAFINYDPGALGLNVFKIIGSEAIVKCPFHKDNSPSAEYNIEKNVFYCFSCHETRTAKQLANELGGSLVPIRSETLRNSIKQGFVGDSGDWLNLTKNPLAFDNSYLVKRKVTNDQVKRYGIKENADGVIFEIKDKWGNLTGVQIRQYERKPKYLIHGDKQKVWPMQNISGNFIFVVEGVFGVLRADLAGVPCVAIMGSGQVEDAAGMLLSRYQRHKIVAIMDRDPAGISAAGKFALHGIPVVLNNVPPDEWSVETWENAPLMKKIYDAGDIVDFCKDPFMRAKIYKQLKKYWEKNIK